MNASTGRPVWYLLTIHWLSLAGAAPDSIVSSIRSVQPDSAGRVQISLDETHRRVISGRLEDQNIQRLLLAAAREPDNPGVRVESVELLKDRSASADDATVSVLQTLVGQEDNTYVRMRCQNALREMNASVGTF